MKENRTYVTLAETEPEVDPTALVDGAVVRVVDPGLLEMVNLGLSA